MTLTVDIPDNLAIQLNKAGGVLSRRALEALAAEEYKRERLSKPELQRLLDRKSTRLNSSHDQISYAVFCLKKKKKKHEENYDETYDRLADPYSRLAGERDLLHPAPLDLDSQTNLYATDRCGMTPATHNECG